jgi:hypothetical protein
MPGLQGLSLTRAQVLSTQLQLICIPRHRRSDISFHSLVSWRSFQVSPSGSLKLTKLDGVLNCNVLYLSRAFSNLTYNYQWDVDPGWHGLDLCYTFYPINIVVDDVPVCDVYSIPVRPQQFQQYLVSFVKYGNPNTGKSPFTPTWPLFLSNKTIVDITYIEDFYVVAPDPELYDNLCGFWQPAPYI